MGIVDKAKQLAGQAQDKVDELRRDGPPRSEAPAPHGDPLAAEAPAPTPHADPAPSDPPRPHGDPADRLPG
jgi:hypothetical protein